MERLLDVPHNGNLYLISFADDVTIIAVGENSVYEARDMLQQIEINATKLELQVNRKKTKAFKSKSENPYSKTQNR